MLSEIPTQIWAAVIPTLLGGLAWCFRKSISQLLGIGKLSRSDHVQFDRDVSAFDANILNSFSVDETGNDTWARLLELKQIEAHFSDLNQHRYSNRSLLEKRNDLTEQLRLLIDSVERRVNYNIAAQRRIIEKVGRARARDITINDLDESEKAAKLSIQNDLDKTKTALRQAYEAFRSFGELKKRKSADFGAQRQ